MMNLKIFIFAAFVLLVLLIPLASRQAQSENYATINGKITDRATSAPLAAEIGLALYSPKGIVLKHAQANAQGEFQFTDLPAGAFYLSTKHDDYAVEHAVFELSAGEIHQVDLRLRVAQHLGGMVRDERGRPLRDAKVRVFYEQEKGFTNHYQWEEGDVRTDETGHFVVDVDPDRALLVQASHEGYLSGLAAPSRHNSEVVLQLARGIVLTGIVSDEFGQPLANAQVALRADSELDGLKDFLPFEMLQQYQQATVTQADGSFRFSNVDSAPHKLTVTHPQMEAKQQTVFTARRTVLKLSLSRKH